MLAARTKAFSFVCHAIDDAGALCGARPAHGHWRPSTHIPINCPRCLFNLSRTRYAICQEPTGLVQQARLLHIREVGPEGVTLGTGKLTTRSLCGRIVGWDKGPLTEGAVTSENLCTSCRRRLIEARMS